MDWEIIQGDALKTLKTLPDQLVQCVVTSPPYWGLRDYGVPGQLGLESNPEEYVTKMVEVFREVRRVLRDDGTLWLNLGDCYATGTKADRQQSKTPGVGANRPEAQNSVARIGNPPGCKTKDLVGIPWMVAFALRTDGWYLRSDIIWSKPNAMPESVTDRPTKSHEYLFLLTKSAKYYYDADAIKEESKEWKGQAATFQRETGKATELTIPGQRKVSHRSDRNRDIYPDNIKNDPTKGMPNYPVNTGNPTRNKRSVWKVPTVNFSGAHFATFPPKLIEPCILAGSKPGCIILDPFSGAGTTGLTTLRHGRRYIGIELNPEYVEMSKRRIQDDMPLFNCL